MQNPAQTYGNVAKQISSPRQLEADLLLQAASRLQSVHDAWTEKQQMLDEALRYNRKLWSIFLSSVTDKENPLPAEILVAAGPIGKLIVAWYWINFRHAPIIDVGSALPVPSAEEACRRSFKRMNSENSKKICRWPKENGLQSPAAV